jgi:hypothetical protein
MGPESSCWLFRERPDTLLTRDLLGHSKRVLEVLPAEVRSDGGT